MISFTLKMKADYFLVDIELGRNSFSCLFCHRAPVKRPNVLDGHLTVNNKADSFDLKHRQNFAGKFSQTGAEKLSRR